MNEMYDCSGFDRFGGAEPTDDDYFLTKAEIEAERKADRLAEIEDLQSEIEDRETELKDLRSRLEELLAG